MNDIAITEILEKYSGIGSCPVRNVISRFSGKWPILILCILAESDSLRFGQLARIIPDISPKMLTTNLRILEEDNLVRRQHYPEIPPRVEYSLTPKGRSLIPILHSLIDWAIANQF